MKFSIDHKSPVPLHAQVEALIRDMQQLKEYREGKLLPNEIELAKQLGISRNTVRQATNKLVIEGVLARKKGFGTRFADRGVDTRLKNWSSFSQEMISKGLEVKNFEIRTAFEVPPEEVLQFLEIPKKTRVFRLDRLRGTPDGPFVLFHSWFHPRVGLKGTEDFSRPLYEILEHEYATVVRLSREEISACSADMLLSSKLGVRMGAPILKRVRMVYDPGNRPVEYNTGYYKGDSFTYKIESERE
ncbi:MAG: GntR family transcriptional regulator [Bacteroidales bacterium]|nr:GntR family transcriptional regulator [Bacteroidales bacterium]MBN2699032.1 GntR family transcriptional regulator [Bacteroidales bacterium]